MVCMTWCQKIIHPIKHVYCDRLVQGASWKCKWIMMRIEYNVDTSLHFSCCQSGLTQAVLDSKVSTADAQSQVLDFLKEHIKPGEAPLAGNSVHADKRFLEKEMPDIVNYLHYRIVGKYNMLEGTVQY